MFLCHTDLGIAGADNADVAAALLQRQGRPILPGIDEGMVPVRLAPPTDP